MEPLWLRRTGVKRAAAKRLSKHPEGHAEAALPLTLLGYIRGM